MKIAQYVETFSYVGMFNTMNFASYICLYLISPFMQHPVSNFVTSQQTLASFYVKRLKIYFQTYCLQHLPLKQKLQPFWSSNFRKLFIFAPLLCTLLIQAIICQHIFCLTSKFCIPIVFVNTMNQFFHFSIYWLLEMVFSFVFFYFFPTFA